MVGVAARLRAGWPGVPNPGGKNRFFSSPKRPDRFRGPPSFMFKGYSGSSPRVKQKECEVNKVKVKVAL